MKNHLVIFAVTFAICLPTALPGSSASLPLLANQLPSGKKESFAKWKPYETQLNHERIAIKFPHEPEVEVQETRSLITSRHHGIIYALSLFHDPERYLNASKAFHQILDTAATYPSTLIDYSIVKIDGLDVLDLVREDLTLKITSRTRCVVSKENFVVAETIVPEGKLDRHERFVNYLKIHR